jgi:hypothetical protein
MESCQVVYFMTKQSAVSDQMEAVETFRKEGFQGLFVKPPKLVSDETEDTLVMTESSMSTAVVVSQGTFYNNSLFRHSN